MGSDETSSRGNESATVAVEDGGEAVSEAKDINGEDIGADLPAQPSEAAADGSGAATEAPATPEEAVDVEGAGAQSHDVGDSKNNIGEMNDADAERTGEGGGQAAGEGSEGEHGVSRERVNVSEHVPPLVVTDIVLVTFREGENVRAVTRSPKTTSRLLSEAHKKSKALKRRHKLCPRSRQLWLG